MQDSVNETAKHRTLQAIRNQAQNHTASNRVIRIQASFCIDVVHATDGSAMFRVRSRHFAAKNSVEFFSVTTFSWHTRPFETHPIKNHTGFWDDFHNVCKGLIFLTKS
jgi:hypothetical protein